MSDQSFTGSTKMGTAGSILTILFINISTGDVLKTAVMAAVGAVVGFFISKLLSYLLSNWRK